MRNVKLPLRTGALVVAVAGWLSVGSLSVGSLSAGWLGLDPLSVTVLGQRTPAPSLVRSHPAIAYGTTADETAITRLNAALKSGAVTLAPEGDTGLLRPVLAALGIKEESQLLVFSKTSFQARLIGPRNPRALYFNDEVAVGYVRGGDVLEFAAQDAKLGTVFYTMHYEPGKVPQAERNDGACVSCHVAEGTANVPGWVIGSVHPGVDGTTLYGPTYVIDHRSPFEFRWGGWYVTGEHRADRHMGNAVAHDQADIGAMVTPETVHVTSVADRFDPKGFLAQTSDLVALMVMEHQGYMTNLITRVGWDARMGKDTVRPLAESAAEFVDYMLFVDEATLPGPITGPTAFTKTFAERGPFDRKGRSLRQLNLRDRLFEFPCSYMIYTPAFDALPAAAKSAVYTRLWEVLSGSDTAKRYERLSPGDRQAIVEILRDTKPDLPDYFQWTGSVEKAGS